MTDNFVIKVLIADDEQGMRMGMHRTLEKFQISADHSDGEFTFAIDEAFDGAEALRLLNEKTYDIMLLDHSMPNCTGLEVLEELKSHEDAPLTIMVTAYSSLDMAVKATKQGAFDFLAKPFTPMELREVISKTALHLLADRAARRLAKDKRRVRFEFLSVLAHELKAPLGAVEGYLRLMDEGITDGDPETTSRMVDRCLARVDGMRKLIFDLLDLTRIESGEKLRVVQTVDLPTIVNQVVETFQPDADSRGITIALELNGDLALKSDSSELEIILNNLVSNAIKYNMDSGKVTVNITGEEEQIVIAVSDTGIGMTEDEVSRLFGEFVRIKNDKTRKILGSGLGLSILRRLADLNGGEVTVTSEEDKGSTFTVTLSRSGCAS